MGKALSWGPADREALLAFYGDLPAETTRSFVVWLDGQPAGVIGVAISRGYATLFSDISPALEPHLRSMPVMRAVRAAITMAKRTGLTLMAFAEQCGGEAILQREGFEADSEPGWWRWDPY
ncbi:MAG: hypothetical protein AB7F22_17745 [Reyranella sp.]|uniref:hypothetical protein n=1 Tax=Reyranella sp. TaxID=1929291 RepID=UPI003D11FED5